MTVEQAVVIGGAAGAWGDSSFALPQLLDDGRCDYVMFEALAEITMGILTRAQRKNPDLGYAIDVVRMIGRDIARLRQQGVRVVTNAGGVNPHGAADALRAMAAQAGVAVRVAVVDGDDLLDRVDELGALVPAGALSCHAYVGARPIAAALDAGADVVITGRCVDSALALGPLIHEFGWRVDQFDALSHGSLAGHLLECGIQSTGGLLTDWQDVPAWEPIGYPIAECRRDGSFVLTKPAGTGGLVDLRTASEQLLYEIGDPARYLLPDVTCDWRCVELAHIGPDRVEVTGARGTAPPATLKACAQVQDGFKVTSLLFLGGRDAVPRAERLGREVRARAERTLARDGYAGLRDYDVEVLGAESTYGPQSRARDAREVVVKIAMHHDDASALTAVVREIPSFAMAVAGLTGGGTGLARPTPLIRLHSAAIPRELVRPTVWLDGASTVVAQESCASVARAAPVLIDIVHDPVPADDRVEVPLISIAHARSGDKGPHANIGVRARHRAFVPILREQLTAEVVARVFAHRIAGPVERYDVPGVDAINFVLHDALGGGGIASLRFDPQGKAYAQQLLDLIVTVPRAWLTHPAFRQAATSPSL